jgi:hypothetical protein
MLCVCRTTFEQASDIDISGLGRAGFLLEIFVRKFIGHNIWKSVRVMEELLQESSQ